MIRNLLAIAALVLCSVAGVNAQVTNYSLKFSSGGSVDCGLMPELDGKTSYAVQFWINPTEWTEGATIYSRGDGFNAKLGAENNVLFTIGTTTITATSTSLTAGTWNQFTLVSDEGSVTVLLNNTSVATATVSAIPTEEEEFILGGGTYAGCIDEIRVWDAALSSDFEYFYNVTLNIWCPQWDDLVMYLKCDQELCDNVVDYKAVYEGGDYNHHGVMSDSGVTRVDASDNTSLPYLLNGAYTANERFYDRGVPRWQYLLSNDIIMLGVESSTDGHLTLKSPNNHATATNCEYLSEYEGREGVLSFKGEGSYLTCTEETLDPDIDESTSRATTGYTFETWIYLEEWTEGAYIFRKETDDGQNGFSIYLGADSTNQVIARCNGSRYVSVNGLTVGEWNHFAVTTAQGGTTASTYYFVYNGSAKMARAAYSDGSTDYTPVGNDTCIAYIGEGLNAKLDNTVVWNIKFGETDLKNHMNNGVSMPSIGGVVTADLLKRGNAYYMYDDPDNVGYDYYSQDHWLAIMTSAFDGYRGFQIRLSVASHTGWQTTIQDATKRAYFAADLAEYSEGYEGVELDLEWIENSSYWTYYGYLMDDIREALPEDKSFYISCHSYSPTYCVPTSKMSLIDGFTFQQYGPQKSWFYYSQYTSSVSTFLNWGFSKDKMVLSYSTTTSGAYDSTGTTMQSSVITGVQNGLLDEDTYERTDANYEMGEYNGAYYFFIGPNQAYKRAKYCTDNNIHGIFYWDMGNDVAVENPYNLARNCSYGLNANVDTLVTEVSVSHYQSGISTVTADKDATLKVVLTPNPVENTMYASLSNGAAVESVAIYDFKGACVLVATGVNGGAVDVSNLTRGIYAVVVKDGDGYSYNTKMIKK